MKREWPHESLDTLPRRRFVKGCLATAIGATCLIDVANAFGESNQAVTPFTYLAPQSALDDLKYRLEHTRWPERETVKDWSQGVPLSELRALVEYWRKDYDWRRGEAALNRFPQYKTTIDGLGIHFIHVRSKHPKAMPIVLTHGWPSTVMLFRDVIGPLAEPTEHGGRAEDAFHVVAPSLPGFGFSDKPRERGWNSERTAKAWAVLMERLEYKRYVAQGGDWGAYVTTAMAQQRAQGLVAIHLNFPLVIPDQIPRKLSQEQRRAVDELNRWRNQGRGYFIIQATRPQTIGYPLMDSPAGQAGWIYDIYHAGTGNRGKPEDFISRDKILDDITLYWLTETAASSARFYLEQVASFGQRNNPGRVDLPVAVSKFPYDLPAPRSWATQVYRKLIYWHDLDRGGHFASLEEPEKFVQELRDFARSLRQI
jgi:pimeloyl-ACP methyl ester carboxylesterase